MRNSLHQRAVPHPGAVLPVSVEHFEGAELAHLGRRECGGGNFWAVGFVCPVGALVNAVTALGPRVALLTRCGVARERSGRILGLVAGISKLRR